ncbi:MAG: GyrI-like domain-containing protein [Oscillospiraceae bacterium]|nr:GyrI-like domain-containing protein [Oscillospiraceae bacterium]
MIKNKDRNAVRIVELPACKMVWSGLCPDEKDETIRRFEKWWNAQDELRRDRFYTRDFMWYDQEAKSIAWGLAVTDPPADTGGFDVIDFPGGLYGVATYAGNGEDAEKGALGAWRTIETWVKKSGCFAVDEGAGRHTMWHCFNPQGALEAMGYGQCDQYVPIRVKEESK